MKHSTGRTAEPAVNKARLTPFRVARPLLLAFAAAALLLTACGGGSPSENSASRDVSDIEVRRVSQQESGLELSYPLPPQKLVTNGSIEGVRYKVRVTGDANGDGSVGPLDLNAVVDNFGSAAGTGEGEAPPAVDFNDDGEVGPLDFNVMIDEFGAELGGFHLYQDLTEAPQDLAGVIGISPSPNYGLQVGASPEGFMEFTHRPPLGNQGWLKLVPLDADGNEIPELAAPILRVKNLAPEVEFAVDRTEFLLAEESPPQIAEFDASGSTDPEGGPLEYAFDPDGDGLFTEFQDSPEFTFDYSNTNSGLKKAKVRVRDGERAVTQGVSEVTVRRFSGMFVDLINEGQEVYACWMSGTRPFLLLSRGRSNAFPKLMLSEADFPAKRADFRPAAAPDQVGERNVGFGLDGDLPMVTGVTSDRDELVFAKSEQARDIRKSDWRGGVVDASEVEFGGRTDPASIGDLPAILYREHSDTTLRYARAKVSFPDSPNDWEVHRPFPSIGVNSQAFSLFSLSDGRPAIAFRTIDEIDGESGGFLAAADSTEPSGAEDWDLHKFSETAQKFRVESLTLEGRPVLFFKGDGDLRLALGRVDLPQQTGDWSIVDIAAVQRSDDVELNMAARSDGGLQLVWGRSPLDSDGKVWLARQTGPEITGSDSFERFLIDTVSAHGRRVHACPMSNDLPGIYYSSAYGPVFSYPRLE